VLIHSHIPIRDIWWLAAGGGASYGARYVKLKVQRVRGGARRTRVLDPTDDLLRLQTLYGYNAHSLVSIAPGAATWSMPGIDGAIVYGEFGRVWLAAGDPLAHADDIKPLVIGFMADASRAKRIAAFVPATDRFASEAIKLGLTAIKIGAAPYFDLPKWQPRGNSAKHMRAGINKALRAGVHMEMVEEFDSAFRREIADLCLQWLKSRRAAASFGWLLALDPFASADRKKLFVARDGNERLVGLLAASPIPARHGWYLEDVLRAPDAPTGTADLLVTEALRHLKESGASWPHWEPHHLRTTGTTIFQLTIIRSLNAPCVRRQDP